MPPTRRRKAARQHLYIRERPIPVEDTTDPMPGPSNEVQNVRPPPETQNVRPTPILPLPADTAALATAPVISAIVRQVIDQLKAEGLTLANAQTTTNQTGYHAAASTSTLHSPTVATAPQPTRNDPVLSEGQVGTRQPQTVVPTASTSTTTERPVPLPNADISVENSVLQASNNITGEQFSTRGLEHGQKPDTGSFRVAEDLNHQVFLLLDNALTDSSKQSYRRVFNLLASFMQSTLSTQCHLPISVDVFALFIASLVQKQLAASTIVSYVSAIGYAHKLGNHPDPSQSFVIKKMLVGLQKSKNKPDSRLPITKHILDQLLLAIKRMKMSDFNKLMFKSMFLLAFHAFLRIGEITEGRNKGNILRLENIQFFTTGNVPSRLEISFHSFKGHYQVHPVTLSLSSQENKECCPVLSLYQYVAQRGSAAGVIYLFQSGKAVSYNYFCTVLRQALLLAGFNPVYYKSHSFRIGAASSAASMGVSESEIQAMGRWHSQAFKRYIRIPTFVAP